jgi:anti-sigma factor ChrR (cupin superfamily)
MQTLASSASEWPDTNAHSSATSTANRSAAVWPDLWAIVQHPEQLFWEPFRPGVEIYRLYGDGQTGPAAALLKYAPGASVPKHEHTGYEHIVVLSGSQRDNHGNHQAGTLVINPPGSSHRVVSDQGCIVLIIWEKPVQMQETEY